ncbi:MAG: EI24 domain-containing protein [Rhodospirillales bacterium]
MVPSLSRALAQLDDPRFRRVIWQSAGYSALLLVAMIVGIGWGLDTLDLTGIGWIDGVLTVLGSLAAVVLAFLLFPAAATVIITSFLIEDVVRAVEARHYPNQPPGRPQPFSEVAWGAFRLLALTVALNLLVLPLYLIPVLNIFVFYLLNGYLLGREYFELVAARRMGPAEVRTAWRAGRARLYAAGVVIALLLSIPLVNWLMPVVAAAFMTHEFESFRRKTLRP